MPNFAQAEIVWMQMKYRSSIVGHFEDKTKGHVVNISIFELFHCSLVECVIKFKEIKCYLCFRSVLYFSENCIISKTVRLREIYHLLSLRTIDKNVSSSIISHSNIIQLYNQNKAFLLASQIALKTQKKILTDR